MGPLRIESTSALARWCAAALLCLGALSLLGGPGRRDPNLDGHGPGGLWRDVLGDRIAATAEAGEKAEGKAKPDGGDQAAARGERREIKGRVYYLHVPPNPGPAPKMLVWLHPSGGDAKPEFDWWKLDKKLTKDTILLAPQSKGRLWNDKQDGAFVTAAIREVMAAHAVDPNRVILGGHSSGGVFAYAYGLRNPGTFAALVPACGYLNERTIPKAKRNAPTIEVYHSPNDTVFPFQEVQGQIAKLKQAGYTVTLHQDKVGHGIGPKLMKLVDTLFARTGQDPAAPAAEDAGDKDSAKTK